MMTPAPVDEELLLDLILRWEELRAKGREVAVEDLCREWPSLEGELRRRLEALEQTAWLEEPLEDLNEPAGSASGDGNGASPATGLIGPIHNAFASPLLAGRYCLETLVAEGGSAQVWRARDLELQRTVAVKIPRQLSDEAADRLLEEAQRVAGLGHPGIVPTYDVGRQGRIVFFVSEFIEGGSLADACREGSATVAELIAWIAQVADALAYAHSRGIVHRDIKPANILIDEHGRARLTDFGIALPPDTPGGSLGTLVYASPEQCNGTPADHRSDIFSLAVVLYEGLVGSLPEQPGKPNGRGLIPSPEIERPLARPLQAVCRRALAADPAERFSTAAAFGRALRSAERRHRHRVFRRLAVAMLVVGLAAAVLALNARPLRNALRPEMAVMGLPAWDAAEQPLTHVLAAVASALPAERAASPKLEFFARLGRDYDQQGGAVVAASGEVYCLPSPAGTMLVIDPASQATRQLTSPLLSGGNYFGGVLAPDGGLYLIPHQATHFIRIDPTTDEVRAFGEASGDIAYWGGVVAGNGKIYAIPSTATHVVEIDPATQECVRFGELSDAPYKYAGGVLAPDGRIYCMPDQARQIMVIDPASRSIEFLVEDLGDDASKAYGGVLAPNGKIYSGASMTGRVIVLDRATDAISFIEVPRDRYIGSVLGGDGRIYSVPNKPGEVLVIDPATDTADLLPGSRITGGFWGAVLTPYGSIIAVPWEANRVLAIDFGSRLPADWPLSRLFNKY